MSLYAFSGEVIDAGLRQLGATKIKMHFGNIYIIDFNLDDRFEVTYIISVTSDNRLFLQRANPYSKIHGKFTNEKEILGFIKNDVDSFKNGKKSKNFGSFVETVRYTLHLRRKLKTFL